MGKLQEFSYSAPNSKNRQIPSKSDPFFVIYNHRRALRAKALKLLKQQRRKEERNILLAQKQAQKEENIRSWNTSMLKQDLAWQNAYDSMKKQVKQQDSTITRGSEYDQKMEKTRLQIIYSFSISEKMSLFQNKFTSFSEQYLHLENQVFAN